MKKHWIGMMMAAALLTFDSVGCGHPPGKPGFRSETLRPGQILGFAVLYKSNCSGCHGDQGLQGAAMPLHNPVYLAWAGRKHILRIVAGGVPKSPMPAFAQSDGGLLTREQVGHIVQGMLSRWGKPGIISNLKPPAYTPPNQGHARKGKADFQIFCAQCHGADGQGVRPGEASAAGSGASSRPLSAIGSIVNPTYLSLISRQGLRDIVVSGLPGEGMPDWRGDAPGKPLTDQDVTDMVAWLVSLRVQFPGRPFPHPRR